MNENFDIKCDSCNSVLEATQEMIGQSLDCPECGNTLEVLWQETGVGDEDSPALVYAYIHFAAQKVIIEGDTEKVNSYLKTKGFSRAEIKALIDEIKLAARHVMSMVVEGKEIQVVLKYLEKKKINPIIAEAAIENICIKLSKDTSFQKDQAVKQMAIGAAVAIIAALISFGTFAAAKSSSRGGSYVVLWGAVLFGILGFAQGVSNYFSSGN